MPSTRERATRGAKIRANKALYGRELAARDKKVKNSPDQGEKAEKDQPISTGPLGAASESDQAIPDPISPPSPDPVSPPSPSPISPPSPSLVKPPPPSPAQQAESPDAAEREYNGVHHGLPEDRILRLLTAKSSQRVSRHRCDNDDPVCTQPLFVDSQRSCSISTSISPNESLNS
ncbi:MAG: hypothetical protein Q9173_005963 [Seirophora scorigena]